jgi:hypothetical protein
LNNVYVLVSNAESIRCYFKAITGKIPQDLERAIKQTTFFVFQLFNMVEALQQMNHQEAHCDIDVDNQSRAEQEKLLKV